MFSVACEVFMSLVTYLFMCLVAHDVVRLHISSHAHVEELTAARRGSSAYFRSRQTSFHCIWPSPPPSEVALPTLARLANTCIDCVGFDAPWLKLQLATPGQ